MSETQKDAVSHHKMLTFVGSLMLLVGCVGFFVWHYRNTIPLAKLLGARSQVVLPNSQAKLLSRATFTCQSGKIINASFFESVQSSTTQLASSTLPQPTGSVMLVLSDGRSMTLLQTISASGVRYANESESFVFWNKGNTAFVEEGQDHTETYSGCVTANSISGVEDWNAYASDARHFSIRYPKGYVLHEDYVYDRLGPAVPKITGVKFGIPASLYQGSNLSGFDTGVSIEQVVSTSSCSALSFLSPDQTIVAKPKSDNGVEYSTAITNGAGAGNFYEEQVFALVGSVPCTAVRYFIHSTNIGNYTTGAVSEFDRVALLAQFDLMRESLVLKP